MNEALARRKLLQAADGIEGLLKQLQKDRGVSLLHQGCHSHTHTQVVTCSPYTVALGLRNHLLRGVINTKGSNMRMMLAYTYSYCEVYYFRPNCYLSRD